MILYNDMLKVYQIIFQQGYDFFIASRQLELIVQMIQEFIFILYNKDKVYAIIMLDDKYKDLFNNINITLEDIELDNNIFNNKLFAKLRFKHHYAIPFTITLEPFLLYKILADYAYSNSNLSLVFFMHIYAKNERANIASYLKKHDVKRTSIYYAYADHIRHKLQQTHYHSILLLASNNKEALMKGITAFKASYFTYSINSNNYKDKLEDQRLYKQILARPKRPFFNNKYTVLSNTELVSLMLPDSLIFRLAIDGIRPYTTGIML